MWVRWTWWSRVLQGRGAGLLLVPGHEHLFGNLVQVPGTALREIVLRGQTEGQIAAGEGLRELVAASLS